MKLPLSVAIKNFFGIFVLTPFEKKLLDQLMETIDANDREILAYQLSHFTSARRLIRHLDERNAYGFTNFYTLRFGKDASAKYQPMRFKNSEPEAILANARVTHKEGQIDVRYWIVRGLFFKMEYRSPQNIYYPSGDYKIEMLDVNL